MKTFNFNQTEGLKLVTQTLSGLQEAYQIFIALAKMAGNKAIITGCEELGNTVSNGVVVIDGEILDFKGGIKQDTVIIKQEIKQSQFENGALKDFETYRYATFGFSSNSYDWSSFKRVPILTDIPSQIATLSTTLNNKIDALSNSIGYLRKGNVFVGDINGKPIGWTFIGTDYKIELINNTGNAGGGDDLYKITFNNPLPTSDYVVFMTINYTGFYNDNNDMAFSVSGKSTTEFYLAVREINNQTQNLTFDYIIFKK
ncbi:hypothetical protein DBR39_13815 [Chryseobacterium sp. KBW03]|uniref:hypothetical protein n=1 Tax=Chryseobacterium sp. KBW03 TaxID=2153362 RepID=UPI000F596BAB|nr:hypothetical protein [Chryseobacterium sp. KBW03]RQO37959.1 hypothetical protein DBR39_13815 [Chryseobacterium sp. KBW03]